MLKLKVNKVWKEKNQLFTVGMLKPFEMLLISMKGILYLVNFLYQ